MPTRSGPLLLAMVVAAGIGLFLFNAIDLVTVLGHNIPSEDLATDYLVAVVIALALGLGLIVLPFPVQDKRLLLWGWTAKCFTTLGLMLIYENNYPLDAYGYYAFAQPDIFWEYWDGFRFGNGGMNVRFLGFIFQYFLPSTYHGLKVMFSMIGFMGIYLFYRAATNFLGREEPRALLALMLYPTILFWSSILGKDPVVVFGIGLYCYGVSRWYRTNSPRHLFIIFLGILGTSSIRVWLGVILLAPLAVFIFQPTWRIFSKILFAGITSVGFFIALGQFQTRFSTETEKDLLETTSAISQSWATGGSGQTMEAEFSSPGKMIMFLPLGMFTAIFRPLPGELGGLFPIIASFENFILLLLCFQAFLRTRLRELAATPVMWAICLIITWSSAYGFVSFQNLGTASRFKVQIIPVVLALVLHLRRRRSQAAPQELAARA